MDPKEEEQVSIFLESVDKEERRLEENIENPGAIRRQLFVDESLPEPIDELASDDDLEDQLEAQESDSDSEQSAGEGETFEIKPEYVGRDKETNWKAHCPLRNKRTADINVVRQLPGARPGNEVNSPSTAWRLFFADDILEDIVQFTNQRIQKVRPNYARERDAVDTSRDEIEAVIGILYMAGVLKSSHQNLFDLWSDDGTGVEFFRNTMNRRRFQFLVRNIRFDNATTRTERKMYDKLAPIRDIFDRIVENCKTNFSVSEYVTVGEMLESFRGRCAFRQFMKNKPAKYGIKIVALACAKTFYTMNMEIHTGIQPDGPYKVENSGLAVVSRLVEPISGTRRNVTTNNLYTSIPLAEHLLHVHKLTLVGTLKKNKQEIPSEFINTKLRPVNSSMFAFRGNITLVSYSASKTEVVPLLSTMHHSVDVDPESGDAKKPFILTFYNSTKGGVDVVDKYKSSYSVSRTSNRWPLTVFFSLLNITGLNSFIVYKHLLCFDVERRNFLKQFARELCHNYLVKRSVQAVLPRPLKRNIRHMLGIPEEEEKPVPREDNKGPGRCVYCGYKKNRKSKTKCSICHHFICKEHSSITCVRCAKIAQQDENSSDTD